jgi:hypothetical protein
MSYIISISRRYHTLYYTPYHIHITQILHSILHSYISSILPRYHTSYDTYYHIHITHILSHIRLPITYILCRYYSPYCLLGIRERIGPQHPLACRQRATKWGPVRIRVRIDPPHPHVCRKRRLIGAVLRMKPEKPRSRVTVGVAR